MKLALAFVFSLLLTTSASAEQFFAPAQGDFLKEADRAILYSANKFDLREEEKNFNLPMTRQLISEIFIANRQAERRNCNGSESAGIQCGLDFNPLLCSYSFSDIYFYGINQQTDTTAIIYSSIRENGDKPTKYSFIKDKDDWKINSIACFNGTGFNE